MTAFTENAERFRPPLTSTDLTDVESRLLRIIGRELPKNRLEPTGLTVADIGGPSTARPVIRLVVAVWARSLLSARHYPFNRLAHFDEQEYRS